MDKIEFLKTIPAINVLSQKTLEKIAAVMEKYEAKQDEIIFSEGDPSDYLYIIETGDALISKRLATGVEKPLSVSSEKSIIGEMSLFSDKTRTACMKAKSKIAYWRIPSKALKEAASEDPDGMLKMVEQLLLLSLERLEFTSRELATIFEISKTIARNLTMDEFCREISWQINYSIPEVNESVFYVWNEFTEEFESPGKPSLAKNHKLVSFISGKSDSVFLSESEINETLKNIINVRCAIVSPIINIYIVGILVSGNTKKPIKYPQSTFDLLNSVALQLSGAIENIRSRQELLAKQRFERTRSGSINF